jgi:subtilisin family serine protease
MSFSFRRGEATRRKRHVRLHLESLEARALLSANLGSMPEWSARDIVWNGRTRTAVADSWIVRTTPTTTAATLGIGSQWQASSIGTGFFSLSAPGASSADVLGWAAKTQGVAYVEPNFVLQTAAVPNDPSFSRLWGLNNTGQSGGLRDADIDAPEAWNTTTGSRDVVVAVIDSGVDYNHPDLKANMWKNPGEIPGDGIDNDKNGKTDDIYGWDAANDDGDPMDDDGHGTHVAGTIGAVGNNSVGIAGVSWNVSLMAVKFLGPNGGTAEDAIEAIQYVTNMRKRGINIVVSNNSWGGGGWDKWEKDAIDQGGEAGILFVAAAGNDYGRNNDVIDHYPSGYDSDAIISVAATNRHNRLANFSNYGPTTVDIGAPGENIYSTLPNNRYGASSGTSMAAPQVTGAIALLAAAKPRLPAADPRLYAAELKAAILSTAQPIPALAGKVATGGLLNAYEALRSLGPWADIVDITPDDRVDAVDEIVISFDRPVSNVDDSDFVLKRVAEDGTIESSLVGIPFKAINDDNTRWRFSGLAAAGLTTRPGRYTLTLNHAVSGIKAVDDEKPLYASQTESWTQLPPDIGDSLRDAEPLTPESAGTIQITGKIGDGKNGLRDIDMYWVELVAGESLLVNTHAHAIGSKLDTVVRIFDSAGKELASNDDYGVGPDSFLSYKAPAAGRYFIGISSFGNSQYSPTVAGSGSPGRTVGEFAMTVTGDPTPPLMPLVADIIDVTPDPDNPAVPAVEIKFNRAVTGLTVDHFRLTRDHVDVSLEGATLSSDDGINWTLSGLGSITAEPGAYTLTLVPNSNITDGAQSLLASAYDSWTVVTPDAADTIANARVFTLDELFAIGGRVSGIIGDGSFGSRDIDFYGAQLEAGKTYTIDINARSLATPSTLDSVLRIFDANGRQMARNDDFNRSHDSFLRFTPKTTGTYYVGVSGYRNSSYNAASGVGRRVGSTGTYEIQFGLAEPAPTRAAAIAAQRSVDRLSRSVPKQAAAFAAFAAQTASASSPAPSNRSARGLRR